MEEAGELGRKGRAGGREPPPALWGIRGRSGRVPILSPCVYLAEPHGGPGATLALPCLSQTHSPFQGEPLGRVQTGGPAPWSAPAALLSQGQRACMCLGFSSWPRGHDLLRVTGAAPAFILPMKQKPVTSLSSQHSWGSCMKPERACGWHCRGELLGRPLPLRCVPPTHTHTCPHHQSTRLLYWVEKTQPSAHRASIRTSISHLRQASCLARQGWAD